MIDLSSPRVIKFKESYEANDLEILAMHEMFCMQSELSSLKNGFLEDLIKLGYSNIEHIIDRKSYLSIKIEQYEKAFIENVNIKKKDVS